MKPRKGKGQKQIKLPLGVIPPSWGERVLAGLSIPNALDITRKTSFVDSPNVRLLLSNGGIIEFDATDNVRIVEDTGEPTTMYIHVEPALIRETLIGAIVVDYEKRLAEQQKMIDALQESSSGLKFRNDSLNNLVSMLKAKVDHRKYKRLSDKGKSQLAFVVKENDE